MLKDVPFSKVISTIIFPFATSPDIFAFLNMLGKEGAIFIYPSLEYKSSFLCVATDFMILATWFF